MPELSYEETVRLLEAECMDAAQRFRDGQLSEDDLLTPFAVYILHAKGVFPGAAEIQEQITEWLGGTVVT